MLIQIAPPPQPTPFAPSLAAHEAVPAHIGPRKLVAAADSLSFDRLGRSYIARHVDRAQAVPSYQKPRDATPCPHLTWQRSSILVGLCVAAAAAWMQQEPMALGAASAVIIGGIAEGSISLAAAASLVALFAFGRAATQTTWGTRHSTAAQTMMLAAFCAYSFRQVPGFERTIFEASRP
jgi:hypothetical protein